MYQKTVASGLRIQWCEERMCFSCSKCKDISNLIGSQSLAYCFRMHQSIAKISSIRMNLPADTTSRDAMISILLSLKEIFRRLNNQIPILDPINDMGINDIEFIESYNKLNELNFIPDAIIYLAAISNDPMGNKFEKITQEINYKSAIKIAKLARENGVKKFVFASSCSMYGFTSNLPKTEISVCSSYTGYSIKYV